MIDERKRRVADNEALFRQVNEEVEALQRGLAEISDDTFHIVCECGDLACQERLVVARAEYEAVRNRGGALFFVLPGHEKPWAEEVVDTTRSYSVVRKHEGASEQLARGTDPRQ